MLRRATEDDAESRVTAARLSALSVVVFRGPLTLGDLARTEGVRSATMTGIVNGLEQAGFVRRREHTRDRRAVLVASTAGGRRVLARARQRRIELISSRLADLSPTELSLLTRAAELIDERFALRPWQPRT
ncbi:MAG TPA: MarR family transcriptional regulator [Solirubrobacteraceae bacterium]|nr:MarR family transcriptional regulator [Solirubrobacteraceae bacterium]